MFALSHTVDIRGVPDFEELLKELGFEEAQRLRSQHDLLSGKEPT